MREDLQIKQYQVNIMKDILENKLSKQQIVAKRDYYQNEINKSKTNRLIMRPEPNFAEEFKTMTENEIRSFIRGNLVKKGKKLRFSMGGGDAGSPGSCTIYNQKILNIFAYLGIYDYTTFLFLDFHKGCPSLSLRYLSDDDDLIIDDDFMIAHSTSEIIFEIIKLTILSGKKTRRRDM